MGEISKTTHKFCHGKVPGDNTCLYWSILLVLRLLSREMFGEDVSSTLLTEILIKKSFKRHLLEEVNIGLRIQVANYIRFHPEMHNIVLNSEADYKDVEAYCSAIEQGELWGGQPELKALSDLYNIIICVIDPTKITPDNSFLPFYYGEDNPLASKCVYIYYNGIDHFDPLYLVNIENPNEKETNLDPNDQIVNDLLKKFIQEKLKHNGAIELGVKIATPVKEAPDSEDGLNETERKSKAIRPNRSMKRKERVLDDIPMSFNNDKQIPIIIPEEYYVPVKRVKTIEDTADSTLILDKNNLEIMAMEKLIYADSFCDESRVHDLEMNQQPTAALPMALNDEHQEEQVEAEEPADNLADDAQGNGEVSDDSAASTTNPLFYKSFANTIRLENEETYYSNNYDIHLNVLYKSLLIYLPEEITQPKKKHFIFSSLFFLSNKNRVNIWSYKNDRYLSDIYISFITSNLC